MGKMSSFPSIFILNIIREQNINTQNAADYCSDLLQQFAATFWVYNGRTTGQGHCVELLMCDSAFISDTHSVHAVTLFKDLEEKICSNILW